jgi:spore coat protein A, manganese oxidase
MFTRRRCLQTSALMGATSMLPIRFARLAHAQPILLDPRTVPKFVNPLPNPLDPSFVFQPSVGTHYEIGIRQIRQNILGPGFPDTPLWGYGNDAQPPTYPGRTFVARRDEQITVRWTNDLVDGMGNPLPHLLPVDTSLHIAHPTGGFSAGIPTVTHLHGGHSESASDGLPEYWFTPGFGQVGPRWIKETYVYDNDQEAAPLWYHDHALGITRLNVYAGLAGFYILRDENEDFLVANKLLPTGPYEVPIVIQDRMFTVHGELFLPSEPEVEGAPEPSILPEFFGDVIVVNGKAWPVLDVEPRQYRLRLLNGSDSAFYTMFLSSGQPFYQIGTDLGLLNAPVALNQLIIGPGERMDVVVDFSGRTGQTIVVRNRARQPFPKGDTLNPNTVGQIMAFRVSQPLSGLPTTTLPDNLRPVLGPLPSPNPPVRTRKLLLFEGEDAFGRLMPLLGTAEPVTAVDGSVVDGTLVWSDPITENPGLGDTEIWEIYNATEDAHPIHLHLVHFRILDRQRFKADIEPKLQTTHDGSTVHGGRIENIRLLGQPRPGQPNEDGRKDTAQMFPGEVTRLIATFDRPGRYVWHCHILSHEDHEMMRPYFVG